MKKLVCLMMVLGLVGLSQAGTVTWDGGGADGQWTTAANWDGDAVPTVLNGSEDNVVIDGAAVNYNAGIGGDFKFEPSSTLTMNNASVTQTTSHWAHFRQQATFSLTNNSALDFQSATFNLLGNATGPKTATLDGSTLSAKEIIVDDEVTLDILNGSTLNQVSTGHVFKLEAGSTVNLVDSTMNVEYLDIKNYAAKASVLNVGANSTLNVGTNLRTVDSLSMINLAGGTVFVDHLDITGLEGKIGAGFFGINGTKSTTLTDYTYYVSGSGVDIVPEPATLVLLGLGGLLIRRKK